MNVRKQCWAWLMTALCAPGMILNAPAMTLADETEQPPQPAVQDPLLKVAPQDGISYSLENVTGTVTIVTEEQPAPANVEVILKRQVDQLEKRLAEAALDAHGKYWVGLMCDAPTALLRAHLNLGADEGLVVEGVSESGPAKKAGFQNMDVLVSATIPGKTEPRSLKTIGDLNEVVQLAETTPVKIEFIRNGRKQSLEVVPAERPKPVSVSVSGVTPKVNTAWTTTPDSVGLRWAGPMVVMSKAEPLPEGMTIDFQPAEGQPEKVIVKKGDQVWTAELKSLDKLPDEISTLVKQQLQQRTGRYTRTSGYQTTAGNVTFTAHAVAPALPDDVTITTVRKGSAPVKVAIQKGDQTWDVTEKDLVKLPVELRPFAEMALHGAPHGPVPFTKIVTMPVQPLVPSISVVDPRSATTTTNVPAARPVQTTFRAVEQQAANQREMERQLKELAEQVEKLRQAVEKTQPKQ